jgi:Ca-activated chloride channel family protein
VDDPVFGKRYVMMPVEVDEGTLKQIADITGGRYFRATDAGALESIYREIDAMEKTKVETKSYVDYSEFGGILLMPALLLLILEIVLKAGPLRKLP